MRLPAQDLNHLRLQINAATAALGMNQMVNDDAFDALVWCLQHTAKGMYAELQQITGNEDEPMIDGENEGIPVRPMKLPPTASTKADPLMFGFPFAVAPLSSNLTLDEAHEYLTSMVSVAVYNMGLSRHTQAHACKAGQHQKLLLEARGLYLQSLKGLDEIVSLNPSGSLIMVYLAVCNNLAQVYDALNDAEKSTEWQQALGQGILSVPPCLSSPVYRHFLNVSDCYGIDLEESYRQTR